MSLTKSTTRRVALLSSSSLAAACIAASASIGFALAPASALAQAVCSETQAQVSDAAADTVTCPAGTYPTGINYTSTGNLSLTVVGFQPPPATPTTSNFGTGGIVAMAGGSTDDITLTFTGTTTALPSYNSQPFPVLLDAQSQTGNVVVDIATNREFTSTAPFISANNPATRRFVRAISTGGGDVSVISSSTGRGGNLRGGTFTATGAADAAAIEARSIGGGDVTIDLDPGNGNGEASGRLYGILASVTGAGDLTITGRGTANTSTANSVGIHATADTGTITIVSGGQSSGRTGVFIDTNGDATFTGAASGTIYGVDVADVAAGTTTTLNLTSISGGTAAVRAAGAGDLLVNVGGISTLNFDFIGMSERIAVGISSWGVSGASTVTAGNFSVNIGPDGALSAGSVPIGGLEPVAVVTFSDPAMSLVNEGLIAIGSDSTSTAWQPAEQEAELRFIGLGEFRHSGLILLGKCGYPCAGGGVGDTTQATDGWYDDLFVFQDGGWIGEEGRILFDVDTNQTQATCAREAVTNDLGAADCLRIVNSTVEGVTYVDINEILAGDRGRLTQQIMEEGILLIDAPGSTVTAENFVLDPTMDGYNADANSLDKGLYQYVFLFDEDASQFRLVGTLSGAAYQLPIAATAAHNMWRTSTGSWLNRQADLRGTLQEGLGGGIWLRASGEQTDRDVATTSMLAGLPFTVDSTHRQDTYAINGGVDIFSGSDGNTGYVVGLMAGYAHSDVQYEASANTQAMDAWTGGIYGGLVVGQLFVDALVNANNVIIDTDAPGFGLLPEGTILSSRMISLGGQLEAGWRLLFDGGFFAEPLASVSYVRSKMDDLQIVPDDASRPGLEVSFEDPSSFRAGVGARFGVDTDVAGMRTQVSLLARTWNDLEGQNTAVIHNLAFPDDEDIRVVDEFSDQFNEVAVGASLWAPNGVVSGFLNLGTKFGEEYEAKTGSVGVRVAW